MTDQKTIYLDYAAATPMLPEVIEAMKPYWRDHFANPSSLHGPGKTAREAVEKARDKVANCLNSSSENIVFTSSGTESITMAISGVMMANPNKNHLITSQIEHPAVLSVCEQLSSRGFEVTYLPVDEFGVVDPNDVKKAINNNTALISVMYANNEIGTIEPIAEIGLIAKQNNILFHTDACQAAGALELNVDKLNVDLMTLNGSKIYGPKGSGVLYVSSPDKIHPLMPGGGQENGLRGGTENVAAIVGFSTALEIMVSNREKNNTHLTKLRDSIISEINLMEKAKLNGHPKFRLPNNVSYCFDGLDSQNLVALLDEKGIACSSGSACSADKTEASHVLLAIGRSYPEAFTGLRISLGINTTATDCRLFLAALNDIMNKSKREVNFG